MNVELECCRCGKRLRVHPDWAGKKARCPACGAVSVVPAAGPAPGTAIRPADPPGPGLPPASGDALTVEPIDSVPPPAGAGGETCPECGHLMAPGAVICLDCGFNRKTGKQLRTVSRRIERTWHLGGLYAPAVVLVFALLGMVVGTAAYLSADLLVGAVLLAAGAVLGALLLGTFTRIRITRDKGGQPLLYRDRWMFFIPVARATFHLDEYQEIRLGHKEGGNGPVLALLVLLILCGLIPGLIFWALLFRGSTFTLEVAAEHEGGLAPDVEPEVLYRGPSEAKMRAIGDALKEIAGLRYG